MLVIALLILAALSAAGVFLLIASIGKPRKPLSAGTASLATAFQALCIVILVLAAIKLGA